MADLTVRKLTKSPVRVDIAENHGWRRLTGDHGVLWLKGVLVGTDEATLSSDLSSAGPEGGASVIATLHGNFAVVFECGNWVLAATDHIGSIPLTYARDGEAWAIDSEARRLAHMFGLTDVEPDALVAIAMEGYTIGRSSFYRGLNALEPGEAVIFQAGKSEPNRQRYYVYRPRPSGETVSRRRLLEVTRSVFEKMIVTLDGRTVVVPLSAGLDSRLVVSALYELGYRNVLCFSYGQPGNHEARAGQRIAAQLGFPWTFVANSQQQQQVTFASTECRAFVAFADTLQAIPFQQDFHAVGELKRSGFVPGDAIFVNGQSGDYITGNHIPQSLIGSLVESDEESRWRRVFEAIVAKQLDLWATLKTSENLTRLDGLLRDELVEIEHWFESSDGDYALYEASEFRNRQSKYVIAGQRTYEWFGYGWRLPLWDRDYLDFWATVPLADKANQSLYREMLVEANWGEVWGQGWTFEQRIVPGWTRFLRFALKAAHAPLGRDRWHRFERQYLEWWTDVVCNYAIVPYSRVINDTRGHRNAIAWHVERYLSDKGYQIDGKPIEAASQCA
jgi:asparagine synthase (glutamine-hydrolysing)